MGVKSFLQTAIKDSQKKTIQSLTICIEEINQVKVNTIQIGIPREDRVASGITGFPIVSFLGSIVALREANPQQCHKIKIQKLRLLAMKGIDNDVIREKTLNSLRI
jgi:hypothetical protein